MTKSKKVKKKNINYQVISIIISIITIFLVISGWSIALYNQQRNDQEILKNNLDYEIEINIRILEEAIKANENYENNSEFSGAKLDYYYLQKYRDNIIDSDYNDKIGQLIKDIKVYNQRVDQILILSSNTKDISYDINVQISNGKGIKQNLNYIKNRLFQKN
jgi:hypothetical protein